MTTPHLRPPYTDEEVRELSLAGAKTALLDDLLREVHAERPASGPARHRTTYRVVLAGLAAAGVVAVGVGVTVTSATTGGPGGGEASPTGPGAATGPGMELAAMAARMPRFVLDEPGWEVTTVYGFGGPEGSLGLTGGSGAREASLGLEWYPAEAYRGYYADRRHDPSIGHEPVRLLDGDATLFTYGPRDHATMLVPSGESFVEIRGTGMSRDVYLALTARLREATVEEFLASLPEDITPPGQQVTRAERLLADIPVPEGFRFEPDTQTLDPYQLGALVTGQVACAWLEEYLDGGPRARDRAADALATAGDWQVLDDMDARGDWPEVVREYAAEVARDEARPRSEYAGGLGCTWRGGDDREG